MLPETLARLRFHHHGNMLSLNNILYQLGIITGEKADKENEKHFYLAMDAFQNMSNRDKREIQRRGRGLR